MTTTFPPSEVSVRRSLVAFQFIGGTCLAVIMLLLVITLSLGYSICTREKEAYDRGQLMESHQDRYTPSSSNQLNMQKISAL